MLAVQLLWLQKLGHFYTALSLIALIFCSKKRRINMAFILSIRLLYFFMLFYHV